MQKPAINHPSNKNYSKYIVIICSALIPSVLFINRFLIPDFSFDTLYYHLFNGLRGVQNYFWLFSSKEFYPVGFGYVAPVYDVIIYIFRAVLGYRLGTVVDLLAYIGIIIVCYKILDEFVDSFKKLHVAIKLILFLNIIIVTELLFQIATQYVDIVDTFFVLLAIYLFFKYLDNKKNIYVWAATILFSITLLAKATNYIYMHIHP